MAEGKDGFVETRNLKAILDLRTVFGELSLELV